MVVAVALLSVGCEKGTGADGASEAEKTAALAPLQLSAEDTLQLGVPAEKLAHLDRVLPQFESYCTVTQSVGQGIPISTKVIDSLGLSLKS